VVSPKGARLRRFSSIKNLQSKQGGIQLGEHSSTIPPAKLVGFEATKGGSFLVYIWDAGKILHSCIQPF
jgi:hypothetical protein